MNPVMGNILPLTWRNSGPHGNNRVALAVARPGAAKPGTSSAAAQVCSHFNPKGKFREDKIEKMLTWRWASMSCTCFLSLPGRFWIPSLILSIPSLLTSLTRSKLQLLNCCCWLYTARLILIYCILPRNNFTKTGHSPLFVTFTTRQSCQKQVLTLNM